MAAAQTIQQVAAKYGLAYPDDVTSTFEQPPRQTSAQRLAARVPAKKKAADDGQRGG